MTLRDNCWPLILHVIRHTHRTITRNVGHRIVRHTAIHAHRVIIVVCAGGVIALPGPVPERPDTAPDVILLPPQWIYPPETPRPEARLVQPAVPVVQPIPEPGTLAVLAGASATLAMLRRRQCPVRA
jgi:hypothetical protein